MSDNVEKDRYVRRIVKEDGRKLFGALLRLVMRRAGVNQPTLAKMCDDYLDELKRKGSIEPGDGADISQSAISDAVTAKEAGVSQSQVTVWCEVLKSIYTSKAHEDRCKSLGIVPPYDFPEDLQIDMFRLAKCGTPREMVAAFGRRKNMVRFLPEKWRNGIVPDPPANPHQNGSPPTYNAANAKGVDMYML